MIRILLALTILFISVAQAKSQPASNRSGTASYYHVKFEGRRTASGQTFSNHKMTAASNHYKLGTRLRVTNPVNKQSVIVVVNDRMEKGSRRLIDLTQKAAKQLCFLNSGLCDVEIEVLADDEKPLLIPPDSVPDTVVSRK